MATGLPVWMQEKKVARVHIVRTCSRVHGKWINAGRPGHAEDMLAAGEAVERGDGVVELVQALSQANPGLQREFFEFLDEEKAK